MMRRQSTIGVIIQSEFQVRHILSQIDCPFCRVGVGKDPPLGIISWGGRAISWGGGAGARGAGGQAYLSMEGRQKVII